MYRIHCEKDVERCHSLSAEKIRCGQDVRRRREAGGRILWRERKDSSPSAEKFAAGRTYGGGERRA
ncbi:MAG: hypothetical protein DBX46_05135 [Clostridiales bacterium]|nr:MAG: hypothetical protein DBX46_05135 [Clostridiales bacterium]